MKKHESNNQKKVFSKKDSKKMGRLKRFLDWMAGAVAESDGGKASCPT